MEDLKIKLPTLPYAMEEAMNRLRVNIKFCGENTRKILITSTLPDEGKSFVSAHLWRLLAEAGFKSVLLDVDLRKSVIKDKFSIKNNEEMYGVGHYLSGQADLDDCIYHDVIENGDIMPCTNNLQNPSSLFEDAKFKDLLDRLAGEYRYVIIDSPPLHNVSDGAQIASLCDGAILVVRSGFARKKFIAQSFKQLELSGCRILGTVLNFVEEGGGRYGSYGKYGKYYGKYYGSYYGK